MKNDQRGLHRQVTRAAQSSRLEVGTAEDPRWIASRDRLRLQYESVDEIILSIDGLQPEKGHETLYVVRELTRKRVWFAEALLSATADEVRSRRAGNHPGQGVGRIPGHASRALDVG